MNGISEFFTVGDYNVNFYCEKNEDTDGKKYNLLQIMKFDGDKVIEENALYMQNCGRGDYARTRTALHNKLTLEALIKLKKFSKIPSCSDVEIALNPNL